MEQFPSQSLSFTIINIFIQQILFNCKLSSKCGYKQKSKTFYCLYNRYGNKYGLGFYDSETSLNKAKRYAHFSCKPSQKKQQQDVLSYIDKL